MKKLFFVACASIALASCTNAPKAVITATLTNAEDQTVYISESIDGDIVKTDSASIVGGKFTLTTENVYPRYVALSFSKTPNVYVPFVIEEGAIMINGDLTKAREIQVTGSKTADLMSAYKAETEPIQKEIMTLTEQYYSIEKDSLSKEEAEAKAEELGTKITELSRKAKDLTAAAIEKNADNVFGAYLMSTKRASSLEEVNELLAKVSPNMPKNKFVDDLNAMKVKYEAIQIGSVAPDFTLTTPEGTSISLSSLKGQVVLIDFWASWCGPCRASNPSVVALYNKYKDAGFTVFGVSLDNEKDKWVEAIQTDSLTWNHGSDLKGWACAPAQTYAVTGIPQTFLIDREGKIAGNGLHGEELEAAIVKLTTNAPAATEEGAEKATETATTETATK